MLTIPSSSGVRLANTVPEVFKNPLRPFNEILWISEADLKL